MKDLFVELNLPKPNDSLMSAITRCVNEAPLDTLNKGNLERFQNYTVNVISRQFEKDDEEVINLAREQYQSFFEEEFFPVLGILTNVNPNEKYACWPPHSDRERIMAMNWYLEEGGEHVPTVYYKQQWDHIPGPGTGRAWKYSEVDLDRPVHFEVGKWYALNVRQAHSIEKIESRRVLFTLSFYNITFEEFKSKYPQYIKTA